MTNLNLHQQAISPQTLMVVERERELQNREQKISKKALQLEVGSKTICFSFNFHLFAFRCSLFFAGRHQHHRSSTGWFSNA